MKKPTDNKLPFFNRQESRQLLSAVRKHVHLQGLTRRWVFNVLSVIFFVLLFFELFLSFSSFNYYYDSIRQNMTLSLNSIVSYFDSSAAEGTSYSTSAQNFVEEFQDRGRMEVHLLNSDGMVFVTTSGFWPSGAADSVLDFSQVLAAPDGIVSSQDRLDNGEHVLTVTSVLTDRKNPTVHIGGVRLVVSLRETRRQLFFLVIVSSAICLGIFLFILSSGSYFIRSILKPVRAINATARQIALGEFDARIESNSTDEIGQLCDTINYMAGELKSTDYMKNEFISSVSHELRTPLTAIKGWGETIRSAGGDTEIIDKGIDVIVKESERLSVIVEDLLDFSRIQNGQLTFKMSPCDVVAELSEAVITFTDVANKAGVQLIYEENETIPQIMGDGARLQQVFVNIIDNAIKYTPAGGTVLISTHLDCGKAVVTVNDTGHGISSQDLDHVKQKFFKGKHATHGSGIGLAVADEIIQQHRGLLDIASTKNVGTTVTVTLPLAPRVDSPTAGTDPSL